jgi:xanthine dehydrogenase accessory factor
MRIILTRLDSANDYQPFTRVERARLENTPARFALVTDSETAQFPLGASFLGDELGLPDDVVSALRLQTSAVRTQTNTATTIATQSAKFLIVTIALPIQLLILGAGPDVMPVVDFAALLDWHVTVLDHRPAYAEPARFANAKRVISQPVTNLELHLQSARYDAAVVMSHHLTSDAGYLSALAHSSIPYVGLLGPAPRRARLMSDIGSRAEGFHGRLHGPIGLDIGASTPETIALAIISEVQAVLAGRSGRSFSETTDAPHPAR